MDEITQKILEINEEEDEIEIILLKEWFVWWFTDNSLPGKLPNYLHTRTLVHLAEVFFEKDKK